MVDGIVLFFKDFGAILGCLSTAIALTALFLKNSKSKMKKRIEEVSQVEETKQKLEDHENKIEDLNKKFNDFLERDEGFKRQIELQHKTQNDVNKKLLASIIENTYYKNMESKTLDMYDFKRISEAHDIYAGDVIRGNSYVTEMFTEMMSWKKV